MTDHPWLAPIVLLLVVVGVLLVPRLLPRPDLTEAKKLVADGALLVDVRSPGEYAAGHLDGAVNIPVDQVERRITEFGPRDRPVVVYCRSGARSAAAARSLTAAGFARVVDAGAMSSW